MLKFIYPLLILVLLAACAPQAASPTTPAPDSPVSSDMTPGGEMPEAPYLPQPGDTELERGNAFIDSAEILVLESFPPQFLLNLGGSLPTPCHQLRVSASPPDSENVIAVTVYTVVDPNTICIQVLQDFIQGVNLGGFPAGTYTVQINGGEQSLSFEAP